MSDHDPAVYYDEPSGSSLDDIHSTLEEILSTLKSTGSVAGWVWVVVFVALLGGWPGSRFDKWTDQVWNSIKYNADIKNVVVEKRPSDCDFFRAPVGEKGCQYKKRRNVFDAEQRRALIQQAKTREEQLTYERQPNRVTLYWEKEDD